MKKNNIKKVLAFTLAEIMIVVGIIGLISIISMPSLIRNIQQREYKTGVKKAHTLVSESFDSMKIDVDNIYKTYSNDNIEPKHLRNIYAKYFGLKSVFPPEAYAEKYYPLNNTTTHVNKDIHSGGGFLARNGMMVMIGKVPKPYDTGENALIISVDVDGPNRGENQLGVDTFSFEIMPTDNILPIGAQSSLRAGTTSFKHIDYCKTNEAGSDLNGIACSYSAVHEAEYMDEIDTNPIKQNCAGIWNKATQTCSCENGYPWNKEQGCYCPDGYTKQGLLCYQNNNNDCILVFGKDQCCEDCDNQYFDEDEKKWKCNEGTLQKIDGEMKCSGCTDGHTFNATKGYCCPNELGLDSNGNCSCEDGKEWVEVEKNCIDDCNKDQIRNQTTGECDCKDNTKTKIIDQLCCDTPTEGTFSPNATTCDDWTCTDTKKIKNDKNQCICNEALGLTSSGEQDCICQNNLIFDNEKGCICPLGKTLEDGICECINGSTADDCGCNPAGGLIASNTGECVCDTSKYFTGTPKTDSEGKQYCECASKRVNQGGSCVCNSEEHFIANSKGECTCDSANHWIINGSSCACDTANDFELIDGECKCNGTISNGKCERLCKNGAVYNSTSHECECNVLDAELSDDKTECQCTVVGAVMNNSLNTYKCECPQGTTLTGTGDNRSCAAGGSCTARGQKWNGSECECQDGTIKNDKGLCTCPEGFFDDTIKNTTLDKDYESTTQSYEKFFCVNKACNDTYGVWTSTDGGTNGSCNCGVGLEFIQQKGCQCIGTDTKATLSASEWNTTAESNQFSIKTTANSCSCANSKLTYKYNKETKSYGCFIDGDYEINNLEDLKEALPLLGTYNFKLTTDIDETEDWSPWGTEENPFKSSFDGDGNTITVNNITGTNNVGFFGYTQKGCSISNLNIVIIGNVTGVENVGALVGLNHCTINNVTITAKNISGNLNVGGAVGANYGAVSYTNINGATILANSAEASIIGGFVGYNEGTINASYVNSDVKVGTDTSKASIVGGFAGQNSNKNSLIRNCYTQAEYVGSIEKIGGFVGLLEDGTISKVYSTTTPNYNSTTYPAGGFAGIITETNKPLVQNSFYYNEIITNAIGTGNSENLKWTLEGLGTNGLKTPSNYICADWGQEKTIWYYPLVKKATSNEEKDEYNYPAIIETTCQNGGLGLTCIICGNNEYFTGNGCVAIYRYSDNENICGTTTCHANEHYNTETKKCVKCISGQIWNSKENICECQFGMELSADGKACVCPNGSVYYSGYGCINCTAGGATLDTVKNECTCTNGNLFDIDLGTCAIACTDYDAIYDAKGGKCQGMPTSLTWDTTNKKAICTATPTININTDTDLYWMSKCSKDVANWTQGKTFTLTSDINMKSYCSNNLFQPIHNFEGSFSGKYEINNTEYSHIISNVTIDKENETTIDKENETNVGLFDTITVTSNYPSVQYLTLTNLKIKGGTNVGGLAGKLTFTNITAGKNAINKITINGGIDENNNNTTQISSENNTTKTCIGGFIGYADGFTEDSKNYYIVLFNNLKNETKISISGKENTYKGGIIGCANSAPGDKAAGTLKVLNANINTNFTNINNAGSILGYSYTTKTPATNSTGSYCSNATALVSGGTISTGYKLTNSCPATE